MITRKIIHSILLFLCMATITSAQAHIVINAGKYAVDSALTLFFGCITAGMGVGTVLTTVQVLQKEDGSLIQRIGDAIGWNICGCAMAGFSALSTNYFYHHACNDFNGVRNEIEVLIENHHK